MKLYGNMRSLARDVGSIVVCQRPIDTLYYVKNGDYDFNTEENQVRVYESADAVLNVPGLNGSACCLRLIVGRSSDQ
jgi:hypothetical protein